MSNEEMTVWRLARLAECADPESAESAGGRFLHGVRLGFADLDADTIRDDDAWDAERHEVADGAVPIYTHTRWSAFVDLAAYLEDTSEFGDYGDDLTRAAGVALYMIADRLLGALRGEWLEEHGTGDDEEEGAE